MVLSFCDRGAQFQAAVAALQERRRERLHARDHIPGIPLPGGSVEAALDTGTAKQSSLQRITVDTTVQPKAIAHHR